MIKFNIKIWKDVHKEVTLKSRYKKIAKDYYTVIIADNFEELYNIADKKCKEKLKRDYNGLCKSMFAIYEDGTRSHKVGYIFLVKDILGAGVVSHECTHAVIYYFDNFIKDKEKIFKSSIYGETFCYMVGSLVRQIYNYCYDNKIFE